MTSAGLSPRSVVYGLTEIAAIGQSLAHYLSPGHIIGLNGDLGVGKTSLVRAILYGLGYDGEVPSPSYALVQPYDPPLLRYAVLHVDLYRVENPDEIDELGLADAARDSLLLVEWPDRLCAVQESQSFVSQIPHIHLDFDGVDCRILTLDAHPYWNDILWPCT